MNNISTSEPVAPEKLSAIFSPARLAPFLDEAGGDLGKAVALYQWSHKLASACFELIAHFEVGLRNAIDDKLTEIVELPSGGIPWFYCDEFSSEGVQRMIEASRQGLSRKARKSRHQIVAGLSFGFWTGLMSSKYEDLWRSGLGEAFPNSDGNRKTVSRSVEEIRKLRNRIAHHDSLLNVDVLFRVEDLFETARFIDADFEAWLRRIERVSAIYEERPVEKSDTLVVPGVESWQLYQELGVYICRPGRSFRPVKYLAFYCDGVVKEDIARIKHKRDNVVWTDAEASNLAKSDNEFDKRLSKIIGKSKALGWNEGAYQVFILTAPSEVGNMAGHRQLKRPITNPKSGRGSAFVNKQRYVSSDQLMTAQTTTDLG